MEISPLSGNKNLVNMRVFKKLKRLITNKTEKVKTKTEKPTKEELPVWFNKTLDKEEASEEDIKEMDDILSGLV